MKKIFLLFCVAVILGCARVKVEAPKEPIKVDISMRLDIYQHISKEIDDIEGIVSGSQEKVKNNDKQSELYYFINEAYAQEALSPEVEQAALRRRDRRAQLAGWEAKGIIGENKSGLAQIRLPEKTDASAETLVKEENNDRMIIYRIVAQQNGTSVEEIQKLYAKRLQSDAPAGTPVEVINASGSGYEWKIKNN